MGLRTYLLQEKSILGCFGQPGQYLKKKFGAHYEQVLRPIFFVFMVKKYISFFYENIVGSALKSCIEGKLVKVKKNREEFSTGENPFFFRAENFNMSTYKIR